MLPRFRASYRESGTSTGESCTNFSTMPRVGLRSTAMIRKWPCQPPPSFRNAMPPTGTSSATVWRDAVAPGSKWKTVAREAKSSGGGSALREARSGSS